MVGKLPSLSRLRLLYVVSPSIPGFCFLLLLLTQPVPLLLDEPGYYLVEAGVSLGVGQLCYIKEADGWKVAGVIGGIEE